MSDAQTFNTRIHAPQSSLGIDVDEIPEVLAQGGDWEEPGRESCPRCQAAAPPRGSTPSR